MTLVKLSFLIMPHKCPRDERRITCCCDKFEQNLCCANFIRVSARTKTRDWASDSYSILLWEEKKNKRSRESDGNQAYLSPRVPNSNGYFSVI